MPEFIPGLELAGLYYREAVRPILQAGYPDLIHSAGLIGPGSEVLGFDTGMSADHNWGTQVVTWRPYEPRSHLDIPDAGPHPFGLESLSLAEIRTFRLK